MSVCPFDCLSLSVFLPAMLCCLDWRINVRITYAVKLTASKIGVSLLVTHETNPISPCISHCWLADWPDLVLGCPSSPYFPSNKSLLRCKQWKQTVTINLTRRTAIVMVMLQLRLNNTLKQNLGSNHVRKNTMSSVSPTSNVNTKTKTVLELYKDIIWYKTGLRFSKKNSVSEINRTNSYVFLYTLNSNE